MLTCENCASDSGVHKVLLEHNDTVYLRLPVAAPTYQWQLWHRPYGPQNLTYLLSGPLQKRFASPDLWTQSFLSLECPFLPTSMRAEPKFQRRLPTEPFLPCALQRQPFPTLGCGNRCFPHQLSLWFCNCFLFIRFPLLVPRPSDTPSDIFVSPAHRRCSGNVYRDGNRWRDLSGHTCGI